ncbi:Smg-4/UPF3 family-domain-containing protein [Aspergillus multicolor]|uniref:putative nonsense-mediated mRNA decay protein Upf3 n=1 Tax=Aspergillus multicolor TaxID=41759 RepID=UPI003CCCA870
MTQILSKSSGGVLQIPASAIQKNAPAPKKAPKLPAPRLKLLVRRLPPGLTQEEFETALGEEWKVGAGKVSWSQYKPGKVSKDPAKPSRPSRAYLYVVSNEHIAPLSDKVRGMPFLDARNTANDPVLLGPPNLEFAPFAKIPGSRVRKDARQGTIDQEPEFIQFLESLTQPITKPAADAAADDESKKETITTTPLVQYIKEKKANKAKEASNKSSRSRSEREPKAEKVQSKKLLQRPEKEVSPVSAEKPEKKSRNDRNDRGDRGDRNDKATKEAVKAANKQAASVASKQAAKASSAQNASKDTTTQPAPERRRERGNVAAVGKILQRDLGLAPSSNRRRGGRGTSGASGENEPRAEPAAATEIKKETSTRSQKASPAAQDAKAKRSNTPQPSETPTSQRSETSTPVQPTSTPRGPRGRGKQSAATTPTTPTSTATQAFLKHANPSQGVTEPLLETAFSPFGKVVKVEIDKKKGFGYVDFAEPESLQKAISASPVTVAQSQVVVLERKANPGAEKGRGKGRGEPKASNPTAPAEAGSNSNRGGKSNEGTGGSGLGGGGGGGGGSSGGRGRRSGRGKGGGSKANGGGGGGGGGGSSNANASEGKNAETK